MILSTLLPQIYQFIKVSFDSGPGHSSGMGLIIIPLVVIPFAIALLIALAIKLLKDIRYKLKG